MTTFLRPTGADLGQDLKRIIRTEVAGSVFKVSVDQLKAIPTSPFAYWFPQSVTKVFSTLSPFNGGRRRGRHGGKTMDDFRFVRLWTEVRRDASGSHRGFVKGGPAVSFYSDVPTVVLWRGDGCELKSFVASVRERNGWSPHWTAVLNGYEAYGSPGITWSLRGPRFSPRAMPADCVFSVRGPAAFDVRSNLPYVFAILSSRAVDLLFKARVGRLDHPEFVVGVLNELPFPAEPPVETAERLGQLSVAGWSVLRRADAAAEFSHAFVLPAMLGVGTGRFADRQAAWAKYGWESRAELNGIRSEIDALAVGLFGLAESDLNAIEHGFQIIGDEGGNGVIGGDDELEDDNSVETVDDAPSLAADLVSWCVGVAVGRFDVRLATGARAWPEEPDPFDPLPACSPGMLADENSLPLEAPPAGYPVEVSSVLVDEAGHGLDITARVRSVFDVVLGEDADQWWVDVGEALSPKGRELTSWLSKGFFDHHLKTYSRSGRKSPILWPLGTTSGSYLVWLYAHRVTGDSLFRVLTDVASPKLVLERRRLSELVQDAGPNPSASQRKAIEGQERLVNELQEFVDELIAAAPLWHPDLNDGFVLVLAPLWRLFAHHKRWSKELHEHWAGLLAGRYDWSSIAMHLWPERVVPKCAEDRSLAIAHRLEDVFWVPEAASPEKWHRRQTPMVAVEQLIADRTNPATKAALELAAP